MRNEFENIDQIGKKASELFSPEAPTMGFSRIRKKILWYSVFNLAILGGLRQYWYLYVFPLIVSLILLALPYFNDSSSFNIASPRVNATYANVDKTNSENKTYDNQAKNSFAQQGNNDFNTAVKKNVYLSNSNNKLFLLPKDQMDSNSSSSEIDVVKSEMITSFSDEYQNLVNKDVVSKIIEKRMNLPYLRRDVSISSPIIELENYKKYSFTRKVEWALVSSSNFSLRNRVSGDFSSEKKYIDKPNISGFGLHAQCSYRNFFARGGLEYEHSVVSLESPIQLFNPTLQDQIIESNHWNIDTNSFWHYTWVQDSTYHIGDSIWQTMVDSSLITAYDTIKTTKYDTLKNSKANVSVSLFMLPISIGYKIPIGFYEFGCSGGISIGYLQKVGGNYFADSNQQYPMIDASQAFLSKQWVYSWQFNLYVNRSMGPHWSIGLMPYYRSDLKVLKNAENGKRLNINTMGVNLSLIYNFL